MMKMAFDTEQCEVEGAVFSAGICERYGNQERMYAWEPRKNMKKIDKKVFGF